MVLTATVSDFLVTPVAVEESGSIQHRVHSGVFVRVELAIIQVL